MQKINKQLLLFSMIMVLLVSVSSVSADGSADSLLSVDNIGSVSAVEEIELSTVSSEDDSCQVSSAEGDSNRIISSSNLAAGSMDDPVSSVDEVSVEDDDVVHSGSSSSKALKDSGDVKASNNVSNGSLGNNTYYIDSLNFNEFFEDNVLKSEIQQYIGHRKGFPVLQYRIRLRCHRHCVV